jgi:glycosyltransferase involved in cell wall biosynthesis
MHVIIVDTTLTTPPTGGAQTFLIGLCKSLIARSWAVSVVTQPGPERSVVAALQEAGAEVHQNLWAETDLPEDRAARLAAWVNSQRADVYVVSISPDAGWLALPLLAPEIATVTIAHNDVAAFYEPLKHYYPFVDCAVGVSEETRRKIINDCHVPAERTRRIPYGVPSITRDEMEARCTTRLGAPGALRVGYVGRLVQLQKRVFDFVPLVEELKRAGVDFELHLIGEGPERAALAEEFERRSPDAPVKFWGWLPPAEVRERLSGFDVFLLLSDYEGLPVALLEAMGHALVPVVTRIESGNLELVRDGESGFVVPVGDVAAAAERLGRLAVDAQALCRMKRAAWETGRRFSVEAMVENYIDCFAHVADAGFDRSHRLGAPRPYPPMPSCVSRYPAWLRRISARLRALAGSVLLARGDHHNHAQS